MSHRIITTSERTWFLFLCYTVLKFLTFSWTYIPMDHCSVITAMAPAVITWCSYSGWRLFLHRKNRYCCLQVNMGWKEINTAQINFLVEFLKFPLMNENNFLFIVSKFLYGACFKNFWTPVRSVIKISLGPDSIRNKNLFRGCHTML